MSVKELLGEAKGRRTSPRPPASPSHVSSASKTEERLPFAELSERSNRVAHFLGTAGVRSGDRILIMLGNVVPLWEVTLTAIKLGAVFSPATAMLTTDP